MHMKNDFILVAECMGHVVGFIQYYFQHFTPQTSGSRMARQHPRPIIYVATLQTASLKTHDEYCRRCQDATASEEDARNFSGAEPRTGILLMALAIAHGAQERKEVALIDSTVEAVPFYRRFFGMHCSSPVGFCKEKRVGSLINFIILFCFLRSPG